MAKLLTVICSDGWRFACNDQKFIQQQIDIHIGETLLTKTPVGIKDFTQEVREDLDWNAECDALGAAEEKPEVPRTKAPQGQIYTVELSDGWAFASDDLRLVTKEAETHAAEAKLEEEITPTVKTQQEWSDKVATKGDIGEIPIDTLPVQPIDGGL